MLHMINKKQTWLGVSSWCVIDLTDIFVMSSRNVWLYVLETVAISAQAISARPYRVPYRVHRTSDFHRLFVEMTFSMKVFLLGLKCYWLGAGVVGGKVEKKSL